MRRLVKLPPVPESEIQRNGMEWLRSQGCLVFRRNCGGMYDVAGNFVRFSEKGASDAWAIAPSGVHLELEFKRSGERPSLDQVNWLMKTNAHGDSASWWVDNLDTLEQVYRWVIGGGRVVYSEEARPYQIKDRKGWRTTWGPSGDFDLYT